MFDQFHTLCHEAINDIDHNTNNPNETHQSSTDIRQYSSLPYAGNMLSETHEYNEYWTLSRHDRPKKEELLQIVKEQGRIVTRYTLKWQAVEMQNLTDRGFLPYESEAISVEELMRFIRNRGLPLPDTPEADRAACVKILEAADENQSFPRFTELPPELRERIYKLYLAEMPEVLLFPAQPPLTRTCKLLRHEALPLFYQATAFKLFYCYEMKRFPGKKPGLKPCLETALFLKSQTVGFAKIELNIGYWPKYSWNRKRETMEVIARCSFSVKTPREQCSVKVEMVGRHSYSKALLDRLRSGLEKRLTRSLRRICEDDGVQRLGSKEIAELRQAAESVYHTCKWSCMEFDAIADLIRGCC